jgi:hypothetical protein
MIDIAVLAVDIENFERFQETGFSCMMVYEKKQGGMTIE